MNKEINEDILKETLVAMFANIMDERNNIDVSLITDALKEKYKTRLKKPEIFSILFAGQVEDIVELVAEQFYDKSSNVMEDKHKPTFIFTNYDFLKRHVEGLGKRREGFGCSADKSRHILNKYLKYALTGEVEEFDMKKGNYWVPKFGTAKQWMGFCDSLYSLYYGKIEDFMMNYSVLITAEIRRYEYDVHKWYIEFIDKTIIHMTTRYDDRNNDPVDIDRFEDKDYFIIRERYLGNRSDEFEDAHNAMLIGEEIEARDAFGCKYKIVPKDLVKRIDYKTEKAFY